jgi:FMN phosphatase YigB (HAD superfamily)
VHTVWLLDFDDTLASGPVTWGYQRALPQFAAAHNLALDPDALAEGLLIAQEQAAVSTDLVPILDQFFARMGWPKALQQTLLQDVQENYAPELFEDTLAFLERLRRAGQTVFVLSNNPRAPRHVERLGLGALIDEVVTPHMLAGAGPKPERSLWDQLVQRFPFVQADCAVVVGDDPWSDLAFAQVCQVRAWLVDRHDRFGGLALDSGVRRVTTLDAVVLDASG